MSRRALAGLALAATLAWAAVAAGAPAPAPLASVRALARSMAGGRSAQARLTYELADPLGGAARVVSGRVRVESPDRVRIDFTGSGESIALRSDGGEWLQPAARQLLRIPAERARSALQWWRVLLPESRATFREDSLGPRRFALVPLEAATEDLRIVVQLDARGNPARLEVTLPGEQPVSYRLSGWSFGAARGAAAYRLAAPEGFETVDLP